jgi:hypothetical protein
MSAGRVPNSRRPEKSPEAFEIAENGNGIRAQLGPDRHCEESGAAIQGIVGLLRWLPDRHASLAVSTLRFSK